MEFFILDLSIILIINETAMNLISLRSWEGKRWLYWLCEIFIYKYHNYKSHALIHSDISFIFMYMHNFEIVVFQQHSILEQHCSYYILEQHSVDSSICSLETTVDYRTTGYHITITFKNNSYDIFVHSFKTLKALFCIAINIFQLSFKQQLLMPRFCAELFEGWKYE